MFRVSGDDLRNWSGLVGVLLIFAGCSQPPAETQSNGSTLVVGLGSKAGPFDLAVATGAEQTIPVRAAYETLIRRKTAANGQDIYGPGLALSWHASSDALNWTFQLAKNRRFDDGSVFDAAAVKFTFDRLKAVGRATASQLNATIDRVIVLDSYSVVIKLREPQPLLLAMLSDRVAAIINPRIANRIPDDRWGSEWLATRTAGTGPFRLVAGRGRGIHTLERNPFWANAMRTFPVHGFERIMFREIPDPAVRRLALEKGEIDFALLPADHIAAIRRRPDIKIISGKILAFNNLALNVESPAFQSVAVRRAVRHAIDTRGIIKYIKGGVASEFSGPFPSGMAGAVAAEPAYDPETAVREAKAALVRTGVPVRLIYPGVAPETDTVAQYIQAALHPLGLAVRLERLSVAAYIDRMSRGNYDAVMMGFVAQYNDPAAIAPFWFGADQPGSANPARFHDTEVTRLLQAAASTNDPQQRAGTYRAIADRTNAAAPYIYLFQNHMSAALRHDLQGFTFDPLDTLNLPVTEMVRK